VVDTYGTDINKAPESTTIKTVLAAYRDAGGSLEEVACNVTFNYPADGVESRVVWRNDGASNYYVMAAPYQTVSMGVLTEVACNDQEGMGQSTSRVSWMSEGGEYFVVVGAYFQFAGGVLRADLTGP
jgi:hypothetical protein